MELILLKDGGLERTDIRGQRTVTHTVHDPPAWRATLDSVNTTTARAAVGVLAGFLGVAALWVGAASAGLLSVALGGTWYALGQLGTAEPTEEVTVSSTPGMTDREVWETLVLNDEDEQVRKEVAERESRKAKREAG